VKGLLVDLLCLVIVNKYSRIKNSRDQSFEIIEIEQHEERDHSPHTDLIIPSGLLITTPLALTVPLHRSIYTQQDAEHASEDRLGR
jgi:hypothetical protein